MNETLNEIPTTTVPQQEVANEKKAPSPLRKNLRKRTRNFENIYGENYEGTFLKKTKQEKTFFISF